MAAGEWRSPDTRRRKEGGVKERGKTQEKKEKKTTKDVSMKIGLYD